MTLPGVTDPVVAQHALLPFAQQLCGGKRATYGHFAFNSIEPLKTDATAGESSIRLKQEVECGGSALEVAAGVQRPAATATDEAWIRTHTADYLKARDAGELDRAESMLAANIRPMQERADARGNREIFRRAAGAALDSRLLGIEWTDDPPGVLPGRYAAIDYVINYKSGATSCGYLAWRQTTSSGYEIVRSEEGLLTADELAHMPAADLPAFRRKMGCRD